MSANISSLLIGFDPAASLGRIPLVLMKVNNHEEGVAYVRRRTVSESLA